MSLFPHQHAALVERLRRDDFAGLSADEAFARLMRPSDHDPGRLEPTDKNLLGLRLLQWMPEAKYRRFPERRRANMVLADDALVKQFPGGTPGMPNVICREDFDLAWKESHGG